MKVNSEKPGLKATVKMCFLLREFPSPPVGIVAADFLYPPVLPLSKLTTVPCLGRGLTCGE